MKNVDPKDPAWQLLRRLARCRAQQLLEHQDRNGMAAQLLPTTEAEMATVQAALAAAASAALHEAIVLLNNEIDEADTAKKRELSKALNRVVNGLKARDANTSLAYTSLALAK